MPPPADTARSTPHRFSGAIISPGVGLSPRVSLHYCDVHALLCERGIPVSHEDIRQWCQQCGQDDAHRRRRRRPQPGDPGHLDEVCVTINGQHHDLWRAVDQDDNVRDILVQRRQHTRAAQQFCRTLLQGLQNVPRVIITDTSHSDGAAKRESVPGVEQR